MVEQVIRLHQLLAHVGIDEVFDLLIGDANALVDQAPLQFLQGHLPPHLFPGLQVDAGLLECCHVLLEAHVAALGHRAEHPVDGVVVEADVDALGDLQLQVFQHQGFEHVFVDRFKVGLGLVVAPGIGDDLRKPAVDLALQHHAGVDNRHDAVEQLALLGERGMRGDDPPQHRGDHWQDCG